MKKNPEPWFSSMGECIECLHMSAYVWYAHTFIWSSSNESTSVNQLVGLINADFNQVLYTLCKACLMREWMPFLTSSLWPCGLKTWKNSVAHLLPRATYSKMHGSMSLRAYTRHWQDPAEVVIAVSVNNQNLNPRMKFGWRTTWWTSSERS